MKETLAGGNRKGVGGVQRGKGRRGRGEGGEREGVCVLEEKVQKWLGEGGEGEGEVGGSDLEKSSTFP